jgi:hypothetical protein
MAVAYRNFRLDLFWAQNALSFAVFLTLALSQLFAYALYLYPRSEWLWFLSVSFNRLVESALLLLEGTPLLNAAPQGLLLLMLCALPALALVRRSWLGTALTGHLALGLCAACGLKYVDQILFPAVSVSNGAAVALPPMSWNATILVVGTLLLAVLCTLNHILFLKEAVAKPGKSCPTLA